MNSLPTIYWILQENHVTPHNLNFLKFFKERVDTINIQYLIPTLWEKTLEIAKELDPIPFSAKIHQLESYEWFCRKRDAISDLHFPDGLPVWQTLILDDLNAGHADPVVPELPHDPNLQFIVMQLPVPLASLENEERLFYACIHWARANKIPVIGYEMLPFDTKWTLTPALVDGVITNTEHSFNHLRSEKTGLKTKIWKLPRYEGKLFSITTTEFWKIGLGQPYQLRQQHNLKNDTLVIYIPHNVALTEELKHIINYLSVMDEQIHLMISIGKDQVRGTHSHQEIIETLSKNKLQNLVSYSFHDVNHLWEMVSADAVICSSNTHATQMSSANDIPTLIVDPDTPPYKGEYLTKSKELADIDDFMVQVRKNHNRETRLIDIFFEILSVTLKSKPIIQRS